MASGHKSAAAMVRHNGSSSGSSSGLLPFDVPGLLALVQQRLDVLNSPAADRSPYGPCHRLSQPLQQQAAHLLDLLLHVAGSWAGSDSNSGTSSSVPGSTTAAAGRSHAGQGGLQEEGQTATLSSSGSSSSSHRRSHPSSCLTPGSLSDQAVPHLQAAVAAIAAAVSGAAGGGGSSGANGGSSSGSRRKQRSGEQEAEWRARMIKKFSAKKAVYENCRMLSQVRHGW